MKNIFAVLVMALMVVACEKIDKTTMSSDALPSVIEPYEEKIVIGEDNLSQSLFLEWSSADYGYKAAISYGLYSLVEGKDPVLVSTTTSTTLDLSYEDLNRAVVGGGAVGNVSNIVSLYVSSYINDHTEPLKSNEITVDITPYKVDYTPYLFMPGSHQGWDPSTAPTLALKDSENGVYGGYLNLPDDGEQFKFTGQNDWSPLNWGGTLSSLVEGGDNITELAERGFYSLSLDLAKLKATASKIGSVGLIGSATPSGWDGDSELLQDGYLWRATLNLTQGEYKVRFNNDWAVSLGGEADNLSESGGNIAFSGRGEYDVVLDLSIYPYKITFTLK